jgi:hypothetical protein
MRTRKIGSKNMPRINQEKAEDEARRFFQRELLPLREHLVTAANSFFATRFDPGLPSYFRARVQATLSAAEMELPECALPAELEQKLGAMWRAQGYPELAALAPSLARLAQLLSASAEPGEEVSPFIYVMF